jgi:hypothetical protein
MAVAGIMIISDNNGVMTVNGVMTCRSNELRHDIRAGWSGSMLVANPLCWFCHDAAQIIN